MNKSELPRLGTSIIWEIYAPTKLVTAVRISELPEYLVWYSENHSRCHALFREQCQNIAKEQQNGRPAILGQES